MRRGVSVLLHQIPAGRDVVANSVPSLVVVSYSGIGRPQKQDAIGSNTSRKKLLSLGRESCNRKTCLLYPAEEKLYLQRWPYPTPCRYNCQVKTAGATPCSCMKGIMVLAPKVEMRNIEAQLSLIWPCNLGARMISMTSKIPTDPVGVSSEGRCRSSPLSNSMSFLDREHIRRFALHSRTFHSIFFLKRSYPVDVLVPDHLIEYVPLPTYLDCRRRWWSAS